MPEPLHVCMVTPSFYPIVGGLETQVARLIPLLGEHQVAAWVLTRRTPGTTAREQYDGVRIERVRIAGGPGLRSLSFTAGGTLRLLRQGRQFDLIHAHGIMSPTTVAVLAGLPTRTPRVVTLHAAYEPAHLLQKPLGATRLRLYRHLIDRFISISADITALLGAHGIPADRVLGIPNGIDTQQFQPASPSERADLRLAQSIAPDIPVAVFAGRLHPVKQVDTLLRAWQQVPDGYLVILGDGDERVRLEILSRKLGIASRVRWQGMVSNVGDWLRLADTFVLPSASEGLSIALLEAMACGATPVATAVGGAVDVIDPGRNGLLVAPGDADGLASALTCALSDSAWRAQAAVAARSTIVERYDLARIAAQLADLYYELASIRRRS
jgi:glycosyltransferase involved in cell wall biosynthesis